MESSGQLSQGRSSSLEPATTQQDHSVWRILVAILWILAVVGMVALSLLIHDHHSPYPFELSLSRTLQATITWPWLGAVFRFMTWINDPIPDTFTVIGLMIIFAIFRWFRQGIFLSLSVLVGNGVDALIGDYVGRPRPLPGMIHVDSRLIFNSFPSGHSCHMMVFYGFLLFLTMTGPVSRWRYHWLVILLQIWCLWNILIMGIARLWEGEHWFLDIFAGYLDGAIWMTLFIVLYQVATRAVQKRKANKAMQAAA